MFSINSTFKNIFTKLPAETNKYFPSCCPLCSLPQAGSLICNACKKALISPEFFCFQCAEPLPDINLQQQSCDQQCSTHRCYRYYCGRCQNSPPAFDQVIARLSYTQPLSGLIQDYKFSHNLTLLPCLVDCLSQQLLANLELGYQLPDVVIAVPLHPSRIKQRGFNQSLLLAKAVVKKFDLPLFSNHLLRSKATGEQAALNRKQRQININKAFKLRLPIELNGKQATKVAIVDDVITSGSTCNEIAKALKRSGVTIVDIWCLAKTPFIK